MTPLQQAAQLALKTLESGALLCEVTAASMLRVALEAEQAQSANSRIASLYEELRKATDGGSESMTHDDAIKQIAYWQNKAQQVAVPVAWLKFARKKPTVISLSFSSELSTLEKAHGFVSIPLCHCTPLAEAQQVAAPKWIAEQIDEFEIRVKSPEGEAWRLRSADKNDIFNNFIWRWAQSMIAAQGDNP